MLTDITVVNDGDPVPAGYSAITQTLDDGMFLFSLFIWTILFTKFHNTASKGLWLDKSELKQVANEKGYIQTIRRYHAQKHSLMVLVKWFCRMYLDLSGPH